MTTDYHREYLSTLLGIISLLLWSTTFATSRILAEQVGVFTSAATSMLLGGGAGLLHLLVVRRKFRAVCALPRPYLIGGTLLIATYMSGLYIAVGFSPTHQQVVEVMLINYLWPGLMLAFSLPILHQRASGWLVPGIVLGFAGVLVATLYTETLSWQTLTAKLHATWPLYLSVLIAAIAWALYSNLTRRWAAGADISAMPLFITISGLVLGATSLLRHEHPQWTPTAGGTLLYVAFGPTLIAYLFWDIAMRKGRHILLASLSNLTPLLATIMTCLFLTGVTLGWSLWLACGLIISGALLCNRAITACPVVATPRDSNV